MKEVNMSDSIQPTPLSSKEKKFNKIDEYVKTHYKEEPNSLYALLEEQARQRRDGIFSRRQGDECKYTKKTFPIYNLSLGELNIDELDEYIEDTDITFQEKLFEYIDRIYRKETIKFEKTDNKSKISEISRTKSIPYSAISSNLPKNGDT